MLTTIRRSEDDFYITIPAKVLSDLGWTVGQDVQVSVDERAIRLNQVSSRNPDSNIEGLALVVHDEALRLFEGDEASKNRWMVTPAQGLGNRTPNEMLLATNDIETVRLLIGRLEHGSLT